MAMETGYRNATADHGGTLISHIGLVDETGTELDGGSPAYARQAVSWDAADNGVIRPTANLTFNIPPGTTVGGWRGFSAASGGTNYGGFDLPHEEFANQGEYILQAAATSIQHNTPGS